VLDAHHFLRDALFGTASVDPEIYWHCPIVVTDMRTPLGSVIGRMRVKPNTPRTMSSTKISSWLAAVAWNSDARRGSKLDYPERHYRQAVIEQ
jgi:hypothetical protein